MKKVVISVLIVVVSGCSRKPSAASAQEAFDIFDQFQTQLLVTLKSAIDSEGVAGAIGRCRTASPDLEKQVSAKGWHVRRISDRPRNPSHIPDEFEARVLARWSKELEAGRKPVPVAQIEEGSLRVMRPIMIQADLCLRCHGEPGKIDPAVSKMLVEQYPSDKALGYKLGDLRGAFSAVKEFQ